ncbi:MAG: hypothetical protein RMY34_26470 [Aulosira sp. DedQUE10]|nr:hypothetical protein [Aulosira sp. DedQUE10]
MNQELNQAIALEVQLFHSIEQKENFLFLLGALLAKVISLQKAAEVMQLEPAEFLKILDLMGIQFSYLSEEDIDLKDIYYLNFFQMKSTSKKRRKY